MIPSAPVESLNCLESFFCAPAGGTAGAGGRAGPGEVLAHLLLQPVFQETNYSKTVMELKTSVLFDRMRDKTQF